MIQLKQEPAMTKTIEAVYEKGVFKPKEPVDLEEKSEVRIIIEGKLDEDDDPTGWKAAQRFIGLIKDEPEGVPVARNHDKHLYE
jgi:predicted DNA-binding antitoxin AbrB/MazE fold protein